MSEMPPRKLPFVSGSVTSKNAADSMIEQAGSLRERVWQWLFHYGPATDKEMQQGLEMDGSTQRPRRIELFQDGRVVPVGKVQQPNGRSAVQWKTAETKSKETLLAEQGVG